VKHALKTHITELLAVLGLLVLAAGIGGYILSQQRFRFPLIESQPKVVEVELENAQAVQPGQGQTVRVAGVQIGAISDVEVEDGVAVVQIEIEEEFENIIREDATALLRPRTGLKDMLLDVDPGQGDPLPAGGRIQVQNTNPDVNPDEVLSTLDSDTRPYLRLLVSGAGKGLKGRGNDLAETLKRLEPLHRDLARVTTAIASRRRNLQALIHNYGLLTRELSTKDADLTRLVGSSNSVLSALASENGNISSFVAKLPGTLRTTQSTLVKVDRLGGKLGPTLEDLRPPFRQLATANRQVLPFVKESTPIIRKQIRPFARQAQPFTRNVGSAARNLSRAGPDLTKTFGKLNRLFNLGAYNPGGAQGLTGNPQVDRNRQEGYLYWLAWTSQNTVSLFNTSDAAGPFRRVYLGGLNCSVIKGQVSDNVPAPLQAAFNTAIDTLGVAGVCTP
jgi:phospholipid/cholesterol/gamma-HCH transport system substrate-binding protein